MFRSARNITGRRIRVIRISTGFRPGFCTNIHKQIQKEQKQKEQEKQRQKQKEEQDEKDTYNEFGLMAGLMLGIPMMLSPKMASKYRNMSPVQFVCSAGTIIIVSTSVGYFWPRTMMTFFFLVGLWSIVSK